MTTIQLLSHMNRRNGRAAHLQDAATAVWLELGPRSFGVLSAPGAFLIRCLGGWAWITQEANSNDIVLEGGQRCQVAGAQKVFLNAWRGAQLTISNAAPASEAKPIDLRLEVTHATYILGGSAEYRSFLTAEDRPTF